MIRISSLFLYRMCSLGCAKVLITGTGLTNVLVRVFGRTRLPSLFLTAEAVLTVRPVKFSAKDGQFALVKSIVLPSASQRRVFANPLVNLHSHIINGDVEAALAESRRLQRALGDIRKVNSYNVPTVNQLTELIKPLKSELEKGKLADIPFVVSGILSNVQAFHLATLSSREQAEVVNGLSQAVNQYA